MENLNSIKDKGLWQLANEIESVAYKIDSVASVVEMIATSIINEPESGAAWAAREMLEVYVGQLEDLSGVVMEMHRFDLSQNAVKPQPTKKGKKK